MNRRKCTSKKTESKTESVIQSRLQVFVPPANGKMTIEDLLNCLPLEIVTQHGEELKTMSIEEAEKAIEDYLDEMFSDDKVEDSFWAENPDDLPLDKDMKEYGEELDRMRLQDELDDLMTQIDRLCTDKLFTTISSSTANKIVAAYNKAEIDPNCDIMQQTSGDPKRKTPYVLSELHVMTISKKVQFETNINNNLKKLIDFLDKYHETSVVEVEE